MEIYECEEAVEQALKQERPNKLVQIINQQLKKENKNGKGIDFVCLECSENGPEGRARAFFSAPPPTVVFCANRLKSKGEVEEALVHELVHAYDFTVRKMDITKPQILACSEIRSAREAECHSTMQLMSRLLPDLPIFQKGSKWLNERCVREHATRSSSSMFPESALDDVDQVFEKCYKDHSPFINTEPKE